jgi:hypothetical protein
MQPYLLLDYVPSWVRDIIYNLPTLLISIAIIVLGIFMVRGKKAEKPQEDIPSFGGDDHE